MKAIPPDLVSPDLVPQDLVIVGRLTAVYGVRGWIKLHSYTEPMENILEFDEWYLQRDGQWQVITPAQVKRHQKGLIVLLDGVEDRDQARSYCQCDIAVAASAMPALSQDDYYWHQLEGLEVRTLQADAPQGGEALLLGKVDHLLETGANDVLVVRACAGSIDDRERLIPWLPDQVIQQVDVPGGRITVDWDPEF